MKLLVLFIFLITNFSTTEGYCPMYLYKIVSVQDWDDSIKSGTVKLGQDDTDFIHFSTEDQLDRIINKYWKDQKYVILKVEVKDLEGDMVYESNPGGENKYYHLYDGSIPLNSVVEVRQ